MEESVPLSEAREHLGDLVSKAEHAGEHVVLSRRGREAAAIVPVELLRKWEAYEDAEDLRITRERLSEPRVTHEELMAEYDLA